MSGFTGSPDSQQVLLFWRSLFEKNSDANLNSVWLSQLREKFAVDHDFLDVELGVNIKLFVNTLNRLQNWASPGPDGIQGYWWKKMTSTHNFCVRISISFLEVTSCYHCGSHVVEHYFCLNVMI